MFVSPPRVRGVGQKTLYVGVSTARDLSIAHVFKCGVWYPGVCILAER